MSKTTLQIKSMQGRKNSEENSKHKEEMQWAENYCQHVTSFTCMYNDFVRETAHKIFLLLASIAENMKIQRKYWKF